MIDLFTVKRNNEYDFVQATLPADDGTWLCSNTAGAYTRGHSYDVDSGVATRIEVAADELIESTIPSVIENTCDYLNNYFYVKRQDNARLSQTFDRLYMHEVELDHDFIRYHADASTYTFIDGVVTGINDDPFIVGDLVQFRGGLRNNLVSYVISESEGSITLNNPSVVNTTESAYVFLMRPPAVFGSTVSQMVWWDAFKRVVSDKDSERVGNYSYSKQDPAVGGSQYPLEIISKLNAYRGVRFVA